MKVKDLILKLQELDPEKEIRRVKIKKDGRVRVNNESDIYLVHDTDEVRTVKNWGVGNNWTAVFPRYIGTPENTARLSANINDAQVSCVLPSEISEHYTGEDPYKPSTELTEHLNFPINFGKE